MPAVRIPEENRRLTLFQDPSGWTPHYTGSGVDHNYEPICFGPAYIPRQRAVQQP